MIQDFEKITLSLEEKSKLFITKLKKKTTEQFLGASKDYLLEIQFIKTNYSNQRNEIGEAIPDRTYSVTWYYNRYLIWKRNRVFYGMLFSFATPIVVSIITSVLTVIVLNKLGLK